jgi:hypothetical protein
MTSQEDALSTFSTGIGTEPLGLPHTIEIFGSVIGPLDGICLHGNIGGDSFLFWPVKRGIHMLGRYIRCVFFSLCLLSVSSLAQSLDSVRHDSYSETDKFVSCAQVTLARHVLY